MRNENRLPEGISPDFLRRLELLSIRGRRAFLGSRQGGHVSLKKGHGIEFSDYRKYSLGDNPRHIDWSVYARNERLYVKQFQEERDLSVLLVLDTSASMQGAGSFEKWTRCKSIALGLAYIALMQHDKVHLCALRQKELYNLRGGASFYRLADALSQVEPSGQDYEEDQKSLRTALRRIRFPGVVFFISDFLFSPTVLASIVDEFLAKNLDTRLVQVLGRYDRSPFEYSDRARLVDSETGKEKECNFNEKNKKEYQDLLFNHVSEVRELCKGKDVRFVSDESESLVQDYFSKDFSRFGVLS